VTACIAPTVLQVRSLVREKFFRERNFENPRLQVRILFDEALRERRVPGCDHRIERRFRLRSSGRLEEHARAQCERQRAGKKAYGDCLLHRFLHAGLRTVRCVLNQCRTFSRGTPVHALTRVPKHYHDGKQKRAVTPVNGSFSAHTQ
jgi:hypothetical protein